MPNWCLNYLNVTGPKEELQRFRDEVKSLTFKKEGVEQVEVPLSFNKHVPLYDLDTGEFLNKGQTLDGLYDSWGTKWDVNNTDVYFEDRSEDPEPELMYQFDTAWGPAETWVKVVVELFPLLDFDCDFEESGCDIYGTFKGSGGVFKEVVRTYEEHLVEEDEIYPCLLDDVEKMTPEEIKTFFSGMNNFVDCCQGEEEWHEGLTKKYEWSEMYNFYPLASHIIKKIAAEDLPLFVNVDWGDDEYNQLIINRLKGGVDA
jgi:hypothetical protein